MMITTRKKKGEEKVPVFKPFVWQIITTTQTSAVPVKCFFAKNVSSFHPVACFQANMCYTIKKPTNC